MCVVYRHVHGHAHTPSTRPAHTRMSAQKARDMLNPNDVHDEHEGEEGEEEGEEEGAAEESVQCDLCGKWCQNTRGLGRHRTACIKAQPKVGIAEQTDGWID